MRTLTPGKVLRCSSESRNLAGPFLSHRPKPLEAQRPTDPAGHLLNLTQVPGLREPERRLRGCDQQSKALEALRGK